MCFIREIILRMRFNFIMPALISFLCFLDFLWRLTLKITIIPTGGGYVRYNFSRIKRLFPLLLIASLEGIAYELLQGKFYPEKWASFFFLGGINQFPVWNVIWYISSLFWCSIFCSGLLCFFKKLSVLFYFPLIAFLSLSLLNIYGNCNLGGTPLLCSWFSSGLVRGLCGLIFGIEAFFLSGYVQQNLYKLKKGTVCFLSYLIEISFIVLVFYLAFKQKFNNREFLMYFSVASLLILIKLNRHHIFKVFNHKIWGILGKISAMIYVTHFYLIKVFSHIDLIRLLPDAAVYCLCSVLSIFVGGIFFELEKKIERLLHNL